MIDNAMRLDDYDRKVAQIHRDVAQSNGGLPDYIEAQQRIAALGPPLSPQQMRALQELRDRPTPGADAGAAPGSATTAGPAEGSTATGPNGQQIILRNGQWVPR